MLGVCALDPLSRRARTHNGGLDQPISHYNCISYPN